MHADVVGGDRLLASAQAALLHNAALPISIQIASMKISAWKDALMCSVAEMDSS